MLAGLDLRDVDGAVLLQVETETKYAGYIRRQAVEIEKIRRHEGIVLPPELEYQSISGLSRELQLKLAAARPQTLAKAARIPGMTPAALSLLLVHARKTRVIGQPEDVAQAGSGERV
jgi:tRNA uridine 5-carboxymethylaminomethyl modification enzyme